MGITDHDYVSVYILEIHPLKLFSMWMSSLKNGCPPLSVTFRVTFPRTSFKSVASRGTTGSRGTSYHSAVSRFLGRSVSDGGPGETSLEGVDNLSFFSFEGGEDVLGSLPSEAQRRLSAGSRGTSLGAGERQQGKEGRDQGPGARVYLGYLLVLIVAALHTASTFVSTLITATSLDPWLLLLGRALLQLLVSIVLLIVTRRNPLGPKGFRWRLYLVGLLSAALVLALHLALTRFAFAFLLSNLCLDHSPGWQLQTPVLFSALPRL